MLVNEWAIEEQLKFHVGIGKTMFIQKKNSTFTSKTMNCELITTSLE